MVLMVGIVIVWYGVWLLWGMPTQRHKVNLSIPHLVFTFRMPSHRCACSSRHKTGARSRMPSIQPSGLPCWRKTLHASARARSLDIIDRSAGVVQNACVRYENIYICYWLLEMYTKCVYGYGCVCLSCGPHIHEHAVWL